MGLGLVRTDPEVALALNAVMEASTGEKFPKDTALRFSRALAEERPLVDAFHESLGDPTSLLGDRANVELATGRGRMARPGGIQVVAGIRFGLALAAVDPVGSLVMSQQFGVPDGLTEDCAAYRAWTEEDPEDD